MVQKYGVAPWEEVRLSITMLANMVTEIKQPFERYRELLNEILMAQEDLDDPELKMHLFDLVSLYNA